MLIPTGAVAREQAMAVTGAVGDALAASATPASDRLIATGLEQVVSPDIFAGKVRPRDSGFDMRQNAQLRMDIRNSIADSMTPLLDDWHEAVRRLDSVPSAALPRSGEAPFTLASWKSYDDLDRFVVADLAKDGRPVEEWVLSRQPDRLLRDPIQVPVGEYGVPMATALTDAARVMGGVLDREISPAARKLTNRAGRMPGTVTFQRTFARTMMEAANTVAGTTGLLTSSRIDGVEGAELIAAMRRGRIYERAAAAPAAVWGPMIFRGQWMPNHALQVSEQGVASLSPAMSRILADTKAARAAAAVPVEPMETALGCPFLARKAAAATDAAIAGEEVSRNYIRRFADDYLKLVERLLAEPLPSAPAV